MMNQFQEFMKNPAMMNQFQEFMKNPEMMKTALNMLQSNPGMMNQFMNMSQATKENQDSKEIIEESNNLHETQFNYNDIVIITNLKNNLYNGCLGEIKSYNQEKNRYQINITKLNKIILIKEENFSLNNN